MESYLRFNAADSMHLGASRNDELADGSRFCSGDALLEV